MMRVYNPAKQSVDHDPTCVFVRAFLPEIDVVPYIFIHEPWRWPGSGALRHSKPIVDHAEAAKAALEALHSLRKKSGHSEVDSQIVAKHGSGKSGMRMTGRKPKATHQVTDG